MYYRASMRRIGWIMLLIIVLSACKEMFDYTPYQVKVEEGDKNQNVKNLKRIKANDAGVFKPFRIILIGDTHNYYDDLNDIVTHINGRDDFDFIINLGDVTMKATANEFNWYLGIIKRLKKPILTIIGNHEYLSTGPYIYKEMFGEPNITFTYNNCKFVLFDDIIWKRVNSKPDFDWFSSNIRNDNNYTHVLPFSHIPPWDREFSYGNELIFNQMLHENNIKYSFHGHLHEFRNEKRYERILGDVSYIVTEAGDDRGYLILTVTEDDMLIEKVNI